MFALLITVSTLFLTLLGYGHDMAYLEQFGLYSEELQRSALDFLLRAWRPVIDAVQHYGSRPKWDVVMTFYQELLRYNLWWLTVAALIWMLVFPRRRSLVIVLPQLEFMCRRAHGRPWRCESILPSAGVLQVGQPFPFSSQRLLFFS